MESTAVTPRKSIKEIVMEKMRAHRAQSFERKQLKRKRTKSFSCDDDRLVSRAVVLGDDDETMFWEEEEGTVEMAQIGADRTKNVLILMSDTGGGHRASAEAIRDAFRIEFGDEYKVFVKDLFTEHAGWPLNDMERSYKFMVKHVQLWRMAFHGTSPRWIHNIYLAAIASLHTKFHSDVNRCYCPSEEVAKRAALVGLQPSQIHVSGLPIRPSFCRAILVKDELRKELEMDADLPAVLLMGGGEGMGPVKKTAKALGESLFDKENGKPIGQLVVICGRNKTLSATLSEIPWKIPVKAGPGTIAEALIRGLPIILNDFIPGQEVGNVPYVVDNGAGVFSKSSKETASLVARWFGPESDVLKKMSENALKLAQPDAVFDIVRDIHELAEQRGPLSQMTHCLTSSFFQSRNSSFISSTS